MGITRHTAALLFAYGYKLIDKEGNSGTILSLDEFGCLLRQEGSHPVDVMFNQIGTDYFVLCRNKSSLTETIEHEGEKVIAKEEILKSIIKEGMSKEAIDYCMYWITDHSYLNEMPLTAVNKLYEFNFPLSGLDESQIKYIKD